MRAHGMHCNAHMHYCNFVSSLNFRLRAENLHEAVSLAFVVLQYIEKSFTDRKSEEEFTTCCPEQNST